MLSSKQLRDYKSQRERARKNAEFQREQTSIHGSIRTKPTKAPHRFGIYAENRGMALRGYMNGHPL
jgi:hypothetical protein